MSVLSICSNPYTEDGEGVCGSCRWIGRVTRFEEVDGIEGVDEKREERNGS